MSELLLKTTRKEATQVIRDAYNARRLVAQAPQAIGGAYSYEAEYGQVYKCAVGVLLTDEQAYEIEHDSPNYLMAPDLLRDGRIEIDDGKWLADVQFAHDNWCGARILLEDNSDPDQRQVREKEVAVARDRFLEMIAEKSGE